MNTALRLTVPRSIQPVSRLMLPASGLVGVLLLGLPLPSAQAIGIIGLGDVSGGAFSSQATGVSSDGRTVVGQGTGSGGGEAFRWVEGSGMQGLGVNQPGSAFFARAADVSGDGRVVVGGSSGSGVHTRWVEGSGMVGLPTPPGGPNVSEAFAISTDATTVVGVGRGASGSEAFRWVDGVGTQGLGDLAGGSFGSRALGTSADGKTVVGIGTSANGFEAFRWTASGGMQGLGDLAGGLFSSQANDVSANGDVVVGYGIGANGYNQAFRWTEAGGMQGLGDLPGGNPTSEAFGVSGDGSIVVGGSHSQFGTALLREEAFLWNSLEGMVSLWSFLTAEGVDLSHWSHLTRAQAISDDGRWVVGFGVNADGATEAFRVDLLTTVVGVPDEGPGLISVTLIFAGLAGWHGRRSRPRNV